MMGINFEKRGITLKPFGQTSQFMSCTSMPGRDHVYQVLFGWLENCGKSLRHNISPTDRPTVCCLQYTPMYIFILNCQISFLLQMSNYDRVTMSHYKTLQMYRTNVCAEKLRNLPSHKSCRKLWTSQKFDKIDKTEWNTLSQLHEAQNCVNYTVELKTTYLELRELHSWT